MLDRLISRLRSRGMTYRAVPKTGLRLSAVGFGTCQLRLVPEQQALDTLKRGFELGVNLVHTAPDYEGADDLVAQAVAESGREIVVLTQGYGDADHLRWLFEQACRKQRRRRLEMYGIACIDDREYLGENVWGPGGQVEFLQEQKRQGRLGGIFCTTHGTPAYVARLIESGVFDAIMLAYNPLGFHLLSYHPQPPKEFEDIPRNRAEIFGLAARRHVALLIMKPLAGGLLSEGKAFPPRGALIGETRRPPAAEVLRSILAHPEVTCVVPGTASVAEAEENARAGHGRQDEAREEPLSKGVAELGATLCSRCGVCDALCSQHLPVSWLFRDTYINAFPSETFETVDGLRYFNLHPSQAATCSTCPDVTCSCPAGIRIPEALQDAHALLGALRDQGLLPPTPAQFAAQEASGPFAAKLVSADVPPRLRPRESAVVRLWLHNAGDREWPGDPIRGVTGRLRVRLLEAVGGSRLGEGRLRHDVPAATRTHAVIPIVAPAVPGDYECRAELTSGDGVPGPSAELKRWTLTVVPAHSHA